MFFDKLVFLYLRIYFFTEITTKINFFVTIIVEVHRQRQYYFSVNIILFKCISVYTSATSYNYLPDKKRENSISNSYIINFINMS